MMRDVRHKLLIVLVFVFVPVVVGCTREPPTPPLPRAGFDAVREATLNATSARYSLSTTVPGAPGASFNMEVLGGFDQERELEETTVALRAEGSSDRTVISHLVRSSPGYYFRAGAIPSEPWTRLDEWELDLRTGRRKVWIDHRLVLWLIEFAHSAESLGIEDVRGVPAVHYRGLVSIPKLTSRADYWILPALVASALSTGRNGVPIDIWADDRNRVVRLEFDRLSPRSDTSFGSLYYEAFDYDEPFYVTNPNGANIATTSYNLATCTVTVTDSDGDTITSSC